MKAEFLFIDKILIQRSATYAHDFLIKTNIYIRKMTNNKLKTIFQSRPKERQFP